uniref:Uncharacterized protein n=1 Tax=Zooxanthella nutricula TaxID=1333877 RepID=A0A7S2P5K5_9DINO
MVSYSMEIAGHLPGYDNLELKQLVLKGCGIASSLACLPLVGLSLTRSNMALFESEERVTVLLYSWRTKLLIYLFHQGEIMGLLNLIPFAFCFRPFGIFALVGAVIVLWIAAALHWRPEGSEGPCGLFVLSFGLLMNHYGNPSSQIFRRVVFVAKPVILIAALAGTVFQSWRHPGIRAAVVDTETWAAIVLLGLGPLGTLVHLIAGMLLWRLGHFSLEGDGPVRSHAW